MTIFEAEITPGMSAAEVVDLAVAVEEAGFDRLGISDVVYWPDPYLLQVMAAERTERILIGSMVTNPYTRHAVAHASALSTLHEVSGGRAFLGIGVGAGLEELGFDDERPVRTLRTAVESIRALLAGEEVHGGRLVRPPETPVPVAIGTRSRQVMALAGELADVALVGARHFTDETVATYRSWLATGAARVGRDPASIDVAPRVTLCVSEDGAAARSSMKRYAAHYLDIVGSAGEVEVGPDQLTAIRAALGRSTGWYFDHDRHDDPELEPLIDDELVEAFAVVGTPDECVDQLRAIVDLGFTSVSCNLGAVRHGGNTMAGGLGETIDGARSILTALAEAG
ncbi:MAG: LLM class flavin-dependent oxidoreductase [Actinomycetota bacterium]